MNNDSKHTINQIMSATEILLKSKSMNEDYKKRFLKLRKIIECRKELNHSDYIGMLKNIVSDMEDDSAKIDIEIAELEKKINKGTFI